MSHPTGDHEYQYRGPEPTHDIDYLWPPALREIGVVPVSICEIGCGNGAFARNLAGLGHRVTGIDSSSSGIRHAIASSSSAVFVEGSVYEETPAEWRHRFDVVLAIEVIEHLMLPRELVRRANELLKVGGRLILSTPYHGFLKNLLITLTGRFDSHFSPLWDGGHVKFFSKSTLRQIVEEELEVQRIWGSGRFPGLWKSLFLVAVKTD